MKMHVIGKSTVTDRARLRVDKLSPYEQKDYYFRNQSWLAYIVTCWKLGELSDEEVLKWKMKVLNGEIR
jgi:hypothetical protein